MRNPLTDDIERVLQRTSGLWDDMRGARVFVSGGTGFFGTWLLESFAHANEKLGLGATAVVLSRDPAAFARRCAVLSSSPCIRLQSGDVRSFDFPDGRFTHVLHCATSSSVPEPERQHFDTIVNGTSRVLEFAVRSGVGKVLLCSSGAVYGTQPPAMENIPEDHGGGPDPADPRSVYAEGKRCAEMLACICARETGIEVKIARGFAFVGPYLPLDAHFAVGNFVRDVLSGGPIRVSGDGSAVRSYLYAADLAEWLWTILLRGKSCRPYNVGSGEGITIAELAATVARVASSPARVEILGRPEPGRPVHRYVPCVRRAREELGLVPSVGLEDAIRRTMAWHRAMTGA